ncbi:hypothetical protein E7T09_18895 [Deinococcus sp. KSM4-11]|nr:hypothetical protein E7T09_18895 [Deinococcus sp. KSM4-11]
MVGVASSNLVASTSTLPPRGSFFIPTRRPSAAVFTFAATRAATGFSTVTFPDPRPGRAAGRSRSVPHAPAAPRTHGVHVQGRRSAGLTCPPCKEAREALQRRGVSTIARYRQRYREVPGLPSNPPEAYAPAWVDWPAFLAPHEARFFPLADAMKAVKPLAI